MKKILSAVLILAMVMTGVCLFTSCDLGATATSVVEKADAALTAAPYSMTVSMDLECDDAELNDILDSMSMEVPVTVDGENIFLSMGVTAESTSIDVKMTVFERVLYYDMSFMGESIKMKATMNDEEYAEFMKDSNTSLPVEPRHFETLTLEKKDGKQVVTCTGLTEEGRAALNEMLGETTGSIDGEAALNDLSYVLTIVDGKYESMAMSVAYSFTEDGKTVNASITMGITFSYENVSPVTAPADADQYTDVNVGDLLG